MRFAIGATVALAAAVARADDASAADAEAAPAVAVAKPTFTVSTVARVGCVHDADPL